MQARKKGSKQTFADSNDWWVARHLVRTTQDPVPLMICYLQQLPYALWSLLPPAQANIRSRRARKSVDALQDWLNDIRPAMQIFRRKPYEYAKI